MLKLALLYKSQLEEAYLSKIMDEKNKYYICNSFYNYELSLAEDSWTQLDLVSVNSEDQVIGYLSASFDRNANSVSHLSIINFYDVNLTFSRDLYQFVNDLFFKYGFRKIKFSVVVGNPAEKMYDKFIEKYNGRIAGVYEDDVVLPDGKYYDIKQYEIHKKNIKMEE